MLFEAVLFGLCVALFFIHILCSCKYYYDQNNQKDANQQEDIFNISSRVQGQGQWPTHDAHVSLDHFAITNEINKYNDDPPTYEEAMNIAASNNNNTVVPAVVPKTTITPSSTTTTTTTTSTSTSAAN
ncbi:ELMO domain-containing protein C-like isoform X14 [Zophobas morio]|uniref:ELMO domain-containing protein C-like isoform X14 n=1 Tax=Zophobas morio TaxID=2755281 RepID=UPI0030830D70